MQADSREAAGCFFGGGGSVPGCGSVCALAAYGRVMTEQRPLEKTDSDSLRRSGVPGDSELYRRCLCKHLTSKHTPPPPQPTPSLSLNPPPHPHWRHFAAVFPHHAHSFLIIRQVAGVSRQ